MIYFVILLIFIIAIIAIIFLYKIPPPSKNIQEIIPISSGLENQNMGNSYMSTAVNLGLTDTQEPNLYLYAQANPSGQPNIQVRIKSPVNTVSINTLSVESKAVLTAGATSVTYNQLTAIPLPDNFDSRTQWPGAITNPLDQVDCGSCWAFSTSTCFSDRYRIRNPNNQNASAATKELYEKFTYIPSPNSASYVSLNNVSPYQIVRCNICPTSSNSINCNQQGCRGGIIADALQFLIKSGANSILGVKSKPLDPNAPLTPQLCTFNNGIPTYNGVQLVKLSQANANGNLSEPAQNMIRIIKQEIITNGPVCAGFTVYNSFYQYTSGIYTTANSSGGIAGGHAIVIVGWGVQNGNQYWIVRNSWGLNWGIGGYFNIAIDWKPPDTNQNGIPTIGILDEVWTISV